jgi:CheY-like chemotaxis protein
MRVLIVDDYPGVVELLDLGLAARGLEVVGATTASEALARAATEEFDAAVLDLQLPDGSGHELLSRLRALPQWGSRPVVGMTSFTSAETARARGLFDGFLPKPFRPKQLASMLRRLKDRVASSLL